MSISSAIIVVATIRAIPAPKKIMKDNVVMIAKHQWTKQNLLSAMHPPQTQTNIRKHPRMRKTKNRICCKSKPARAPMIP